MDLVAAEVRLRKWWLLATLEHMSSPKRERWPAAKILNFTVVLRSYCRGEQDKCTIKGESSP